MSTRSGETLEPTAGGRTTSQLLSPWSHRALRYRAGGPSTPQSCEETETELSQKGRGQEREEGRGEETRENRGVLYVCAHCPHGPVKIKISPAFGKTADQERQERHLNCKAPKGPCVSRPGLGLSFLHGQLWGPGRLCSPSGSSISRSGIQARPQIPARFLERQEQLKRPEKESCNSSICPSCVPPFGSHRPLWSASWLIVT